jgi:hypothetical protein
MALLLLGPPFSSDNSFLDRHLLVHAMASDFSVTWQYIFSKKTIVFFVMDPLSVFSLITVQTDLIKSTPDGADAVQLVRDHRQGVPPEGVQRDDRVHPAHQDDARVQERDEAELRHQVGDRR